ncbi:winged helix-turn-helix transcriptional regulator [Sulfurisphaera javensis]|uniref:Winged helix-turn-helix transcriptional regulator n=1 Tax=Sulfurisphaera javensis TaxID=2049879 RepID=A0AAT9GMY2_9CREN
MDSVDKKIILSLFKDGRISQRKIAEEVGLSATSLNYRFNKLLEDKIIKSFSLYVNPNFYGKFVARASFKNSKDFDSKFVNVKVKCLEEENVYEIEGTSVNDLQDKISYMSKELGEYSMIYIPEQNPQKPSGVDIEIVKTLIKNPRMDIGEIAKEINIPSKTILRRLNALINKNFIRIIPIIDISKSDIIVFGVFSRIVNKMEYLNQCEFLRFTDGERGIVVCAVDSLKTAESYVNQIRKQDDNAKIMIATEYEIRNDNAKEELEKIEKQAILNNMEDS